MQQEEEMNKKKSKKEQRKGRETKMERYACVRKTRDEEDERYTGYCVPRLHARARPHMR